MEPFTDGKMPDEAGRDDAHEAMAKAWTIAMCGPNKCPHDFTGWRNFEDGCGGEMACSKCGLGALAYSLQQS